MAHANSILEGEKAVDGTIYFLCLIAFIRSNDSRQMIKALLL